jgi:hypothetical protein
MVMLNTEDKQIYDLTHIAHLELGSALVNSQCLSSLFSQLSTMILFSVVTVNDYLAQRDAEWMGRVHRFLGLTVGLVQVYTL